VNFGARGARGQNPKIRISVSGESMDMIRKMTRETANRMNSALRGFLVSYALNLVIGGCVGLRLMRQRRRMPVKAKDVAPARVMKKPSLAIAR
jgi:hypothetical protein